MSVRTTSREARASVAGRIARQARLTARRDAPMVAASIAGALVESADLDPSIVAGLIREAGLAAGLPCAHGARIEGWQFSQLWRLLAARLDDEMVGLLPRPVRAGSTKLLASSLIDAPQLQTALHRMRSFVHITREDFSLDISRRAERVHITILPRPARDAGSALGLLMVLKLVHGLASWLIGRTIALREVDFAFPGQGTMADCPALFRASVRFDQTQTALSFDAALLQQPLRRSRSELRSFLAHTPHDWLFVADPPPLIDQVRKRLHAQLRAGPPRHGPPPAFAQTLAGLAETARSLHMSPRTLARRLEAEGISFQTIKDGVRRDHAIDRLTVSRLPLASIGEELGFDDPASFFRAFRRWTGSTPGRYRREGSRTGGQLPVRDPFAPSDGHQL